MSNFYIEPDKTHVEGEYQAEKHASPECRAGCRALCLSVGPGTAKRLGRRFPLRGDWFSVRVSVMKALVLKKFLDHPDLKEQLLATGSQELVEENYWGDTFWGVCRGVGKNHLGKILMEVRGELQ